MYYSNRISIMIMLVCTVTAVVGFQSSTVPFVCTRSNTNNMMRQTDIVKMEANTKSTFEESIEQLVRTSSKVVPTFVLGWTLASSIAMANTNAIIDTATIDESLFLQQQQQPTNVLSLVLGTEETQQPTLFAEISSTTINEVAVDAILSSSADVVAEVAEPSMTLSALGGNIDVVDFSLPSYNDAINSGSIDTKKVAPTFNPFGDFSPEIVSGGDNLKAKAEEKAAADAAKAEEQAAAKAEADARKAEDRAAKEARKAEEKAAADAAKAEKDAAEAAKKAARQAQIEEQREKQRAAVESQKQAAASASKGDSDTDTTAPPTVGGFDIPDMSAIKIPDISAVKIPDMPAVKMPDMSAVKMPDMSGVKMPDMSGVKMPDMSGIKIPEFTAPEMPKVSIPKFDMPSAPSTGSSGDVSSFSMPAFDAPKVSLPDVKFANPFGSGDSSSSTSSDDGEVESQEVRDEKAREARQVFLAAENDAKEAEAVAKAMRATAAEKKSLAKVAKDEACKTRPGGKFICLRNPFTSGY